MVTVNRRGERIYSPVQRRPSVLPEARLYQNLHEWVLSKSSAYADRTALVCATSGRQITYAQFESRTTALAAELYHELNIRSGDVVAIVSPNTVDYPSIFHAILKLGAKITTVNPMYSAEELRKQLDLSGAKAIVTISMFEHLAREASALASSDGTARPVAILLSDRPLVSGTTPLPSSALGFLNGKPNDTIVIPFSSGTTGLPKGVQLTNLNLISNILQTQTAIDFTSDDVTMAVLPYFHIYAMTAVMHGTMNMGGHQIVFPKFDLLQYLEKLQHYRGSMLFVAPPMLVGFLKHPATQSTDRSSARVIVSGAAPLHRDVQQMCEELFPNGKICQGYGLTETSPVTNFAFPGVYGAAGALVSDTEMRIVKVEEVQVGDGGAPSTGIDVEEGEEGEIWFRGPQVMKGYLRSEDTAKVFVEGGWFRTGDIGRLDPSNEHLIITDRLKELIKYKGYQIAPAELEGIIQTHPLVQETIVVAIPDSFDSGCELPRAQVVLKATATEDERKNAEHIISHYVEKHVAPYKKLRGGVRVVQSIPKSPAGKLLRRIAKVEEMEYIKQHPRYPHQHVEHHV